MGTGTLTLTKHEACGNDFLVLLDMEDRRPFTGDEVRLLCDRHRGIGADGILRARPGSGGSDMTMELHNADGSEAEMSGNGIRCVVQAVKEAGLIASDSVSVATLGGMRQVEYRSGDSAAVAMARVDMGAPRIGAELSSDELPGHRRGRAVDMGNPHVVLLGPVPSDDEVCGDGRRLSEQGPAGANVEFVWSAPVADELYLRVWERGVGETLSCGTGACAVAAALHDWGVVGSTVQVHSSGGTLEVALRDGAAMLAGPTHRVGRVEVDEEALEVLVRAAVMAVHLPVSSEEVAINR